jgi:hypothetical protein
MAKALPPDLFADALTAITGWRVDPDQPVLCPVCGVPGLKIVDQSARPYTEWYALNCEACGLEHTLHIPLAPPI